MRLDRQHPVTPHLAIGFNIWKSYATTTYSSSCGTLEGRTPSGTPSPSRQYWEMYYPNTNVILYVVDSHYKGRLAKATEEPTKVLEVLLDGFRRRFCRECRC